MPATWVTTGSSWVRFIEHHRVVGSEQVAVAEQVDAVQVLVGHDDSSPRRAGTSLLGEAVVALGATLGADALGTAHRHRRPHPRVGRDRQLGTVAGTRSGCPLLDVCELTLARQLCGGCGAAREVEVLLRALAEAVAAQVVVAALEDFPPHWASEPLGHASGHEREILADELILQCQGRSGDDDALARGHSERGGHQVGERFADAGARLAQQRAPVADCFVHGGCHLGLTGPLLAAARELGDDLVERRSGVGDLRRRRIGSWGKVPRLGSGVVGHLPPDGRGLPAGATVGDEPPAIVCVSEIGRTRPRRQGFYPAQCEFGCGNRPVAPADPRGLCDGRQRTLGPSARAAAH